jgi:hypothetical protein
MIHTHNTAPTQFVAALDELAVERSGTSMRHYGRTLCREG